MFLSIPAEIRNQIYYLLLIVPPPGTPRPLGVAPKVYPQILGVCRQIHREAVVVLYGMNTFVAHPARLTESPSLSRMHLPVTSPSLIRFIKRYHIYVRLDCDAHFTAAKARDAFSGVNELT